MVVPAVALMVCSAGRGQAPQLLDIAPSGTPSEALRNAPLSAETRLEIEKALDAHDFVHAETVLLKEIDAHPKSPQLLALAGGVFFLDRKYLNCAIALKKAEAIAPLDDRSRFTLAMAYVTLNHRDWARPELERLARSDPTNYVYPYWLSRLDYDAMNFKRAVSEAQRAVSLNPHFMRAYDQLGLSNEGLGKYDDAIRAYRRAVDLNKSARPCSPWPSHDLGALLTKLGRLEEADESLKASLECDPKLPQAHYQMGVLLERQKKYGPAAEWLKQAVLLDPKYAEPYYLLGQIYRREGDSTKAAEAWAAFHRLKEPASPGQPHQ